MLRYIPLWIVCAVGGALVGFNVNQLGIPKNNVLFVIGLITVSLSICQMGRIGRRNATETGGEQKWMKVDSSSRRNSSIR